jgi:hypothetical protein
MRRFIMPVAQAVRIPRDVASRRPVANFLNIDLRGAMRLAVGLAISFLTLGCSGKPGSGELLGVFQQPVVVVVADETAIYGLGADLERIPAAGGPSAVLASELDGVSLVVGGASLFWYEQADKTIVTLPKAGGTPSVLASSQYDAGGLQSDGMNLYWFTNEYLTATEPWTVRSMPLGGGPVTELLNLTGVAISAMVVDDSRIYFLTEDRSGTVPQTGPYGIQMIPKDGSSAAVMLQPSDGFGIQGLMRAGTGLFWIGGPITAPEIRRMELGTGAITTFAQLPRTGSISLLMDAAGAFGFVQECGNKYSGCWTWLRTVPDWKDRAYVKGFAWAAALDARFVYWVINGRELRRVPR